MGRTIAKVRVSCTKEQMQEAMRQSRADEAAVLFFLIGAVHENLMLQGHTAADVLDAACRLLRVPDGAISDMLHEAGLR